MSKAPKLHSIKTVIRARDFAHSRAFYSEIFALEVAEAWDVGDDRGCIFKLGLAGFLEVSAANASEKSQTAHALAANDKIELQLRTDSVEEWVRRFERFGLEFEGPVTRTWGYRYLWVRDPDGVRIALFEIGGPS